MGDFILSSQDRSDGTWERFFLDFGEHVRSTSNPNSTQTIGSARFIDWLLVDLPSLQQRRVEVRQHRCISLSLLPMH